MNAVKIILVMVVLSLFIVFDSQTEAAFRRKPKPIPAGDAPATFISAFNNRQPIKIGYGVSLYVIGWRKIDRRNYEFAFNFLAEPQSDGTLPKIKGISLYIFSARPQPLVQISYENTNQWMNYLSAYQPAAADQIIDEHGGPNSFYTLNYAWLIGASFKEYSHDLGVVFVKIPAARSNNRLKFVVETYVLE